MEHTVTMRVEKSHIDHLNHVNYVQYITYLQSARKEWYEQAGLSFEKMKEKNIGLTMKRLDVQYFKEALLGETLKIVTSPERLGNKSFVLKQVIFNEQEQPINEANVTMVFFDLSTRTGIKVPCEIASRFKVEG